MKRNSHLEWNVPYQPGIIEARGSRNGKTITAKIETTGEPLVLRLTPDRIFIKADGEDLSIITVSALDKEKREVPTADNPIMFTLKGEGKIIGVGNGDPSSHEPDKYLTGNYHRQLFGGKCQIIVQSSREAGKIELTASSERLKSATAIITTKSCTQRPGVPVYEQQTIQHLARGKSIKYETVYNSRYIGGGESGLIDGILGTTDFKDGLWQGFEKNDFTAIIDLGASTKISSIESDYLNDIDSWIFLPKSVNYEMSEDGVNFKSVATLANDVPENSSELLIKKFIASVQECHGRYLKVTAKNVGTCPLWHKGAGGDAWIFVDEIIVK